MMLVEGKVVKMEAWLAARALRRKGAKVREILCPNCGDAAVEVITQEAGLRVFCPSEPPA